MLKEQLTIPFTAESLRDTGMQMALESADKKHESWADQCYRALIEYLTINKKPFMCEYFREWCERKRKVPEPPSKRAYGAIISKAAKAGLIKHMGYSETSNYKAHKTPASVWQKI